MTVPSPYRLPSNRVSIAANHVLCTGIVQTRESKDLILPVVAAMTVTSHASDAMVAIPFWLEMFAVVAASISGVLVAREHKLDLVGAVALAVVCGLGGGLLRDMTLQVGNVYILNQPMALPLSIATAAIIYIFPAIVDKPEKLIPLLDIISVGIYAATGADKALVYGFAPAVCIMMGFFTAVGGGMLRDGFMGVVPGIFQRTNHIIQNQVHGRSDENRCQTHHKYRSCPTKICLIDMQCIIIFGTAEMRITLRKTG